MRTLTTNWFRVADVLARVLAAFALIGAAVYPLLGPVYLRTANQPLSVLVIAGTCALWLAVAVGAFALSRRKVAGVWLVLLPAMALVVSGQFLAGVAVASALVLVFCTPFFLAFIEARAKAVSGGAA
jgi:hypothetical protein